MDRSVEVKLIKEVHTQDALRQWVSTESSRTVYADVRSIARTEWFEAGRSGINPDYTFILFKADWDGEVILEYNNERYAVYRTYERRNDKIELYCTLKGGLDGEQV